MPSACARRKELLKSLADYPRSARKLAGVLVADGAPFRSGGMEAGEKRPGLRWALSRCRCDEREVSVPHGMVRPLRLQSATWLSRHREARVAFGR